ncbi:hypothetical protein DSO57_1005790 [Entomophthora muscae]|uniref:Uncharacterized protein n=1 Tax=Entomophthora muscae TaxID=34485 RepID=A0ACC2SWW1_9FUNG|nr:hypothetical protein DSO57_1005790 [Entomophthora muscae]
MNFLESQLVFYGSYHRNKINIITHIICVPFILWSAEVALGKLSLEIGTFKPLPLNDFVVTLDLPFLASLLYSVYYISLDAIPGLIYTPILLAMSHHASLYSKLSHSGYTALYIHVVCWIAQFLSHGFAEKRAPALIDGFFQAITLAPFFVFYEVLFYFGFRKDLQKRINERISRNLGAYHTQLLREKKAR